MAILFSSSDDCRWPKIQFKKPEKMFFVSREFSRFVNFAFLQHFCHCFHHVHCFFHNYHSWFHHNHSVFHNFHCVLGQNRTHFHFGSPQMSGFSVCLQSVTNIIFGIEYEYEYIRKFNFGRIRISNIFVLWKMNIHIRIKKIRRFILDYLNIFEWFPFLNWSSSLKTCF